MVLNEFNKKFYSDERNKNFNVVGAGFSISNPSIFEYTNLSRRASDAVYFLPEAHNIRRSKSDIFLLEKNKNNSQKALSHIKGKKIGSALDLVQRRVSQACALCRQRKIKCDGKKPECQVCVRKNLQCVYLIKKKRGRPPKISCDYSKGCSAENNWILQYDYSQKSSLASTESASILSPTTFSAKENNSNNPIQFELGEHSSEELQSFENYNKNYSRKGSENPNMDIDKTYSSKFMNMELADVNLNEISNFYLSQNNIQTTENNNIYNMEFFDLKNKNASLESIEQNKNIMLGINLKNQLFDSKNYEGKDINDIDNENEKTIFFLKTRSNTIDDNNHPLPTNSNDSQYISLEKMSTLNCFENLAIDSSDSCTNNNKEHYKNLKEEKSLELNDIFFTSSDQDKASMNMNSCTDYNISDVFGCNNVIDSSYFFNTIFNMSFSELKQNHGCLENTINTLSKHLSLSFKDTVHIHKRLCYFFDEGYLSIIAKIWLVYVLVDYPVISINQFLLDLKLGNFYNGVWCYICLLGTIVLINIADSLGIKCIIFQLASVIKILYMELTRLLPKITNSSTSINHDLFLKYFIMYLVEKMLKNSVQSCVYMETAQR
ncbi:hypothetical protein BB561_004105 [Smittium simulii]|uniref:Zn(2)-C6 fungal-type domain-containing protein n=1 Tax=Smittium simulii TaxID=133385 RepID=A0A2T9YHY5_9FUNG|nr:hypothetical protein BB561_004105 [Smittium simulii]